MALVVLTLLLATASAVRPEQEWRRAKKVAGGHIAVLAETRSDPHVPEWTQSADQRVCHDPMTCGPDKPKHPLLDGCKGGNVFSYFGQPRLAAHDERAGEAICCNEAGQATRNIIEGVRPLYNVNANGKRVLSHENCTTHNTSSVKNSDSNTPSHTWDEAKQMCAGVGLRLCRSQAELDTSCGTGCNFNAALAWIDDTEVKHHSLLDGCSGHGDLFPGWGEPRPAFHNETLGEAICCNEEGQATRNVIKGERALYNTDADGKRILSHEDCTTPDSEKVKNSDTPSYTYDDAKATCEGVGLRLCRNQAELDTSCGTGCHFNFALAWVEDESRHGRCRDFECSSCSSGKCDTANEAQMCCAENSKCSAVYGGGSHWWTFNAPCVEVEHSNQYVVFHNPGA